MMTKPDLVQLMREKKMISDRSEAVQKPSAEPSVLELGNAGDTEARVLISRREVEERDDPVSRWNALVSSGYINPKKIEMIMELARKDPAFLSKEAARFRNMSGADYIATSGSTRFLKLDSKKGLSPIPNNFFGRIEETKSS
jgi:hypothetical protein